MNNLFGEGISFDDLTFTQEYNDLIISLFGDPSQGIRIEYFFNGGAYLLEKLEFADGSSFDVGNSGLTLQQTNNDENISGTEYDDVIYGNGGDDDVFGDEGNDMIVGGQGNDALNGGNGNDVYVWNLGDGLDSIFDNTGDDKIVFEHGISQDNLSFEQSEHDLKIFVNNDENSGFQIKNYYVNRIETVEFHDGSSLDISNADQLIQAMNSFGAETSSTMDDFSNPVQNVSDMCNLAAGADLIKRAG